MWFKNNLLLTFVVLILIGGHSLTSAEEVMVNDKKYDTTFLTNEMSYSLQLLSDEKKRDALKDEKSLIDLVAGMVFTKNINLAAQSITVDKDPLAYWRYQLALRNAQNQLFLKYYKETVEVPDMTELAKEVFIVNGGHYVETPESRLSSHILFKCQVGCDRAAKRVVAEGVLKRLEQGEEFEPLVQEYSDDENSKKKNGQLDWYTRGQHRVDGHFLKGLFEIKDKGNYSIVKTKFGFHIVRLDDIRYKVLMDFDIAKVALIEKLSDKYRELSLTRQLKEFVMTNDVTIEVEKIKDMLNEAAAIKSD